MSSYSTSKTSLVQEDKSVSAAGDAENILGPNAQQILSEGSTILDRPNSGRDIIVNQFPEAVKNTVGDLISSVDTTTKTIGQALAQQQIGGESELSKIVMYLVIGGGVLLVTSRLISR
jgi:hypothetical protein